MTRDTYTLTQGEWTALGGTPPESDWYNPEELKLVVTKTLMAMGRQSHKTGLVPADQDVMPIWEAVAKRLNIRVLSIRWPDASYPDILAEPLD